VSHARDGARTEKQTAYKAAAHAAQRAHTGLGTGGPGCGFRQFKNAWGWTMKSEGEFKKRDRRDRVEEDMKEVGYSTRGG
jgi:hypothetical protein